MTKVLLYSGGVDSTCLSLLWKPDVALYIKHEGIGYPYGEKEFAGLLPPVNGKLVVHSITEPPPDAPGAQGLRVPTRVGFYAVAASFYGEEIGVGILSNEVAMMKRGLEDIKRSLDLLWVPRDRTFTFDLPAKDFTKTQLVAEYLKAGGKVERLKQASSCFDPVKWSCGECRGCKERQEAFEANGIV